jgi:hypothetical protein
VTPLVSRACRPSFVSGEGFSRAWSELMPRGSARGRRFKSGRGARGQIGVPALCTSAQISQYLAVGPVVRAAIARPGWPTPGGRVRAGCRARHRSRPDRAKGRRACAAGLAAAKRADSGPMHLRGHDSNHDMLLGAVLEWAPEGTSTRRRRPIAAVPKTKRLGNGVVQRAVVQILAGADRVLSVADVHAAVEARLGQRVSEDSVRSCLSAGARGAEPRFRRIAPGRYGLARPI